jgi:NAD(P)-dependent dehydrogenase (short-subunit alcohol dehydrogenase family)
MTKGILHGHTASVTGGSRGIGAAIVRSLVQAGAARMMSSPRACILPDSGEEIDGKDNAIAIIGRGFDPKSLLPSLRYFAGRS